MLSPAFFTFILNMSLMQLSGSGGSVLAADVDEIALHDRAGDAAVQELIDHVLALRLTTGRTLGSQIAGSPAAERALRVAVFRDHERGPPRPVEEGGLEVEVSIARPELARLLEQVISKHLPGVEAGRFALDTRAGPVTATGVVFVGDEFGSHRPGWRHCTLRQLMLAAQAADVDLRHNVLAGLAELPLSNRHTLGYLFALQPGLRAAMAAGVAALPASEVEFVDGGLCRKTLRLSHREVMRIVAAAAADARPAAELALEFSAGQKPLQFDGWAVPPPFQPSGPSTEAESRRPS